MLLHIWEVFHVDQVSPLGRFCGDWWWWRSQSLVNRRSSPLAAAVTPLLKTPRHPKAATITPPLSPLALICQILLFQSSYVSGEADSWRFDLRSILDGIEVSLWMAPRFYLDPSPLPPCGKLVIIPLRKYITSNAIRMLFEGPETSTKWKADSVTDHGGHLWILEVI